MAIFICAAPTRRRPRRLIGYVSHPTEQVQATGSTAQPTEGERGPIALNPLSPSGELGLSMAQPVHRSQPGSQAWRGTGSGPRHAAIAPAVVNLRGCPVGAGCTTVRF